MTDADNSPPGENGTSEAYENATERFWDGEPCPHEWCDGELQHQDRFNVTCLSCESAWSHAVLPATVRSEPPTHQLQGAGGGVAVSTTDTDQ